MICVVKKKPNITLDKIVCEKLVMRKMFICD